MASNGKHVVFDVVGTLIGYDHLYRAIERRLGDRLRDEGVKPSLLGELWFEVAEREYTYLSMSGKYTPFLDVFSQLFYRILWKSGIAEPRKFASTEDLDFLLDAFRRLEPRPGADECIQKLRDAGFTVWGFTAGDLRRVSGYFLAAGIELPAENLLSCDTEGIGKPDPRSYIPLLKQLSEDGAPPWFAAAHMWDTTAARRSGFKGAYCSILEQEPLPALFGDVDVVGSTLPEMAEGIIAASL